MSYRNNVHNTPPPPCYYVLHLTGNNTVRSSGSSYTWRINLPDVSSQKQYYIRPTKVYIQELNVANSAVRCLVMTSKTCRLQNSFTSGMVGEGAGYSNILGAFEIQHTNSNYFVAYNEEPHMNFLSGGFVNGGALQNNEFELRFSDLNNNDAEFVSTIYADFFVEISLFEIYNPQYAITKQYEHDKVVYAGTNTSQIQGRV